MRKVVILRIGWSLLVLVLNLILLAIESGSSCSWGKMVCSGGINKVWIGVGVHRPWGVAA